MPPILAADKSRLTAGSKCPTMFPSPSGLMTKQSSSVQVTSFPFIPRSTEATFSTVRSPIDVRSFLDPYSATARSFAVHVSLLGERAEKHPRRANNWEGEKMDSMDVEGGGAVYDGRGLEDDESSTLKPKISKARSEARSEQEV